MPAGNQKQLLGQEGERLAERYLKKKGYRLVERNYRCPAGELDLIALDRHVIVFVEVKTRTDDRFGGPLDSVHWRKQQRMIRAAQFFLSQKSLHQREARFDVVGVSFVDQKPVVEHIQNAFEFF
ncbi:MAG TPA: YraN family protein [Candidatus Binatia bacterium]|jgi:putative endonuclease|nr:YraN family protein [Candidatus Binatia bacterium]